MLQETSTGVLGLHNLWKTTVVTQFVKVQPMRLLILLMQWNQNTSKVCCKVVFPREKQNAKGILEVILINSITSKCILQMANLFSHLTVCVMQSCPIWWGKLQIYLGLNILMMPFENTNSVLWKVVWNSFQILFWTRTQRGTILNLGVILYFSRGLSQCIPACSILNSKHLQASALLHYRSCLTKSRPLHF